MGMCPFAAKSNYRIHVYTNDDDQSAGMEAFIVAHAHKLASRKDNDHHHPTTILVFPELDMDDALAQRVLLSEAVALSNGLMGSHMVDVHSQIERLEEVAMATLQEKMELAEKNGEEFSQAEFDKILNELISNVQPPAEDNASPILSVPFSTMTDNAADSNKLVMIQGQAPWFTIQLFLREDMNKARGVGNKMQQQIIARNEDMDARIDNESKNQLFQSFRNM